MGFGVVVSGTKSRVLSCGRRALATGNTQIVLASDIDWVIGMDGIRNMAQRALQENLLMGLLHGRRLAFSDRCLPECECEIQQFRLAIYPICRFVTGTRWQALGRGKVSSRHPELTASHTNLSAVGSS